MVRQQFSKPHVYFAGSHEGCGCGFSYGRYPTRDAEDEENARKAKDSVARLREFLRRGVVDEGPLELFACWAGDELQPPRHRRTVTPEQIGGEMFWFEEGSLL